MKNLATIVASVTVSLFLLTLLWRQHSIDDSSLIEEKVAVRDSSSEPSVSVPSRVFSLEELAQHSSKRGSEIYLSHKNKVYDVSSSENFREKGGYSYLTGRDSTLVMAKMDDNDSLFNRYGEVELTETEQNSVDEWETYFSKKYPLVGVLVK